MCVFLVHFFGASGEELLGLEVTDDGPHSEARDEADHGVADGDDEVVGNDGLLVLVVAAVGGHDTHADTDREEDLSDGIGPHLADIDASASSLITCEVLGDAAAGALKGSTSDDHDDDEGQRNEHGEPNDLAGDLDTLGDAAEDT